MKVLIAGSRTFNDFSLLEKELMMYFKEKGLHRADVEIVSGGANGADKLGEQFANKYRLKLSRFPADWNTYGKSAGYKRNVQMAEYLDSDDIVFAFWDGSSKGTTHMINIAKSKNIAVKIVKF